MQINAVSGQVRAAQSGKNDISSQVRKEIQSLKQQIKDVRTEIKKVQRNTELTDAQKDAQQKLLEKKIESLQQQISVQQQKLAEAQQEKQKENSPKTEEAPQTEQAQQATGMTEEQAHSMLTSDLDLARVERLDRVEISLRGRAKTLSSAIEQDDGFSRGGALQSTRDELSQVNARISSLHMRVGSELGKINETVREEDADLLEQVQKEDQLSVREKREDGQAEKDDNKHIDAYA
ncbi:MAG: hypothetical protein HFG20_06720 [Anaerotruncus sp.]|nr:hypothetical protein [Anaerotruncus sp.]